MKDKPDSQLTRSRLSRLARQSAIYALGNLALKAGGLLLLPLYLDSTFLSQADYGRLGLIETTTQLLIVFSGLGMVTGLMKYATDPEFEEEREALISTAFIATAAVAATAAATIWAFASPLSVLLLDDPTRRLVIVLAGSYAALKATGAIPYMVLRVGERAGLYVTAFVIEFSLLIGGVWYALAVKQAGLEGILVAFVLSAGSATLLLSTAMLARNQWRFRLRFARMLLRFGLPLTLGGLATILLNTGDRFILEALSGASMVAVYVLAAKFGSVVYLLFAQSFNMAFSVSGLKAASSKGEGTRLHIRTFRHYVVLSGWGVLGVSILALDVIVLLSANLAYRAAESLVLPIALGFMVYGIYFIAVNLLYVAKRTRVIALNVLLAALLNVVLNVILIPYLGGMGAALATLASYSGLAVVTVREANRDGAVTFPWNVLGIVVLLILGLWALAQPSLGWTQPVRITWRIGIIALYPPLILTTGVYSREELRIAWSWLGKYVADLKRPARLEP